MGKFQRLAMLSKTFMFMFRLLLPLRFMVVLFQAKALTCLVVSPFDVKNLRSEFE